MKDPYSGLYEVTEIHNLRDVIKKRVNEFPENPVFLVKEKKGGEYIPISTEKYDHDIDSLGTYFMSTVKKGARIAIFAETRYEWYTTYLATTNGTGCIVPLDKELPVDDVLNMLTRAEVEILVFSKSKLDIVKQVYGKVDTIKYWICTEKLDDDRRFLYYQDCLKAGEEKLAAGDKTFTEATIDPEEMTILLFTSGTTAKSKAVMLCQKNICKNLMSMFSMLYIDRNDVWLSVLPLHHTYECTCGFLGQVYRGTTVGICEGLRYIAQNLQEVRPTCILMVPVMLELFYKKIMKGLKEDPKKAKKLQTGMKLANALHLPVSMRRKLFKPIHDIFGGRMRLIILGGAPVNPEILTFFQTMGFKCVQGYGLTECAPILALNRDKFFKNHAAGLPLPGCDVKILDPDENGIGEFISKGDNNFMGYYNDPENTAIALDKDGYYHTGDLGYIDSDGFCIITGRKKNVIIAKNGKNVFPEEIEYLLSLSPYVAESVVSGVNDEVKDDIVVTATIFPDLEEIKAKLGIETDPTEEQIMAILKEVVAATNEKLESYKKIKNTVLRMTEFEKNTSKKIKRY